MAEGGWFSRLKSGLSRSSGRLTESIGAIFTKRKLDETALEELEEALIAGDIGVTAAARLTAELARKRFGKDVSPEEVKGDLAEAVTAILEPLARPLAIDAAHRPHVVLMMGVNGTGKTTTIGKLAKLYTDQGLKVVLAAGDTFRAAAIEQLQIWGERTGAPVVALAGYRRDQVVYTQGKPRIFSSSPGVGRAFCGDCGTPLTWEGDGGEIGPMVELLVNTFDKPEDFAPECHIHHQERLPWLEIHDTLPRYRVWHDGEDAAYLHGPAD